MGKQREARMVHRAQYALGLTLARQVEITVNRAAHEIEPRENGVGKIEPAVFEYVDFYSLEQRDAR